MILHPCTIHRICPGVRCTLYNFVIRAPYTLIVHNEKLSQVVPKNFFHPSNFPKFFSIFNVKKLDLPAVDTRLGLVEEYSL